MRRAVLVCAMVATAMLLAVGGVALAATMSSVAAPDTLQVDGRVNAILVVGDRVYLGGDFTHVNGVRRNYLAAMDASTGQLSDWNPNANGSVRALSLSPDGTRIYAGGGFTSIGVSIAVAWQHWTPPRERSTGHSSPASSTPRCAPSPSRAGTSM